jgi:DNA adenine methylase
MQHVVADSLEHHDRPRPFLKWAGGKTQLIPQILARFPKKYARYFEPFLGGGAVFFALAPKTAWLSDTNAQLIAAYTAIRDDLPSVVAALRSHVATEQHFYEVRAQQVGGLSEVQSAARTIFLNRTCFNGLYRVNSRGQFNVPFGKYKNPKICDVENLTRVSHALRSVTLRHADVFTAARDARAGDLVYFDPPYDPLSPSASFTSYTAGGFSREDQARLAGLARDLADRGVHVLLSNSDTPFIRQLYAGFRVEGVFARRAINSRADRRGPVGELLISA